MGVVREGEEGRFMKKKRRTRVMTSESKGDEEVLEEEEEEGVEMKAIPMPFLYSFCVVASTHNITIHKPHKRIGPHPFPRSFLFNKSSKRPLCLKSVRHFSMPISYFGRLKNI